MKRMVWLLVPGALLAQSYPALVGECGGSPVLQSARHAEEAAFETYRSAWGRHLPSLDASLNMLKRDETPSVMFGPAPMPTGTRNQSVGEVRLSYPLFSGFAISAGVDKAKKLHEYARLRQLDQERNLYAEATRLYAAIAVSDATIGAIEQAQKAISDAYAKARGLHENGLLAPSELYALEARRYEISARLDEAKSTRSQWMNSLSYLCGVDVQSPIALPVMADEPQKEAILSAAMEGREDLLSLQRMLEVSESDVTLAQSRFYPRITLLAALKRQGDTLALNGDGYTNADQSYAAMAAEWNLFDGFGDTHALSAARASRLSAHASLEDYRRRVQTEIENAFLAYETLKTRHESLRMQVRASAEYAALTQGRFENQLCSADELSRAIADLAQARAMMAQVEGELFSGRVRLWLLGGTERFRDAVRTDLAP